jgi:hypothetical protein
VAAEIKGRQPDLALVYFIHKRCVCACASAPSRAVLYIEAIKFADIYTRAGKNENKKRLKKPTWCAPPALGCVKFALGRFFSEL